MVLNVLCCAPAATSEPTNEMPEMALVADMSGVCKRTDARDHLVTKKGCQHEKYCGNGCLGVHGVEARSGRGFRP